MRRCCTRWVAGGELGYGLHVSVFSTCCIAGGDYRQLHMHHVSIVVLLYALSEQGYCKSLALDVDKAKATHTSCCFIAPAAIALDD